MATWKKVLTHSSAVSDTEGLKINAGSIDATNKTIVLSDGTNTDAVTIAVSTGLSIAQVDDVITLTNTVVNTDTQLTEEQVQDFAWNVLGGTQTGISVTYADGTNDVDFVVNNSSLVASSDTNAVVLTLTGPAGDTDTITINEGSNITIDSIGPGAFTINAATLTEEQVEDYVWTMLDGAHTGLSIVYADEDAGGLGELTFTVDDQDFTTVTAGNNINIVLSQPDNDAIFSVSAGNNVTLTNSGNADGFSIAVTNSDIQAALQTETLVASESGSNVVLTLTGSAGETDAVTLNAGSGVTLTSADGGNITIAATVPTGISVTDTDDNITVYPMFASTNTGSATVYVDSSTITYNPSTDTLTVYNLTVAGTQTTVNTTDLVIADKNIVLASGAGSAVNATGAGITLDTGATTADPGLIWKETANLSGWHVTDYDTDDFPIAVMEFSTTTAAPGASDDSAGRGSFYTTSDGKLYFRTV